MAAWEELHSLIRRVEEVARRIEQGERLAFSDRGRDEFYGCYPRSYLADRLPAELARAERFGRSLALGLLAFEEPAFTSESVQGWREALSTSLDPFDVPVQYGSRRLLLILPEIARGDARQKAERLAHELVLQRVASRTPRIGVVVYPERKLSPERLLEALEKEVELRREKEPSRRVVERLAVLGPAEDRPPPGGEHRPAHSGSQNGLAGSSRQSEAPSGDADAPVAVGFASNRRFPVSFWRGETLHVIHAILADETAPSGSRRFSVLTDGGGFLLYEKAGRWYAEALPPSNGQVKSPAP